jgi:cell fate (sporulation/competence/biofilm development) regulator YlbF (YheA/YmcA/DUF963 family)
MSRKLLLMVALPAVLALMFLGAGCGGDDDESSDEAAPAAAATTEASPPPPPPPAASGGSPENCQEFQQAAAQVGQQFSAATTGTGSENLDEAAEAFDKLANNAPEEIRADFQTINEAFKALVEALEGVDLSGGKTPDAATLAKLQQAMAKIDQAKVTAANTRITAWVQKNCKS